MADQEQPAIKLYWLDKSRAQRTLWLLEELHLKYDVELLYRDKATMLAPDILTKIHPLGHSPVVTVTPAAQPGLPEEEEKRRIVLAESGYITEYLVEKFPEHGNKLVPKKWKEGMEGKIGGETDDWMRYKYYLQYVEGSLMPILVLALIIGRLKGPDVPFFVRPLTSAVANRIISLFIFPNAKRHLGMIEQHLGESTGKYLCGDTLTAADILLSFPILAARDRFNEFGTWDSPDGRWQTSHPNLVRYIELLDNDESHLRSIEKIKALNGGVWTGYNL